MNPDLNYLIALTKSADLRRVADQARLVQETQTTRIEGQRQTSAAQTMVRLKLRNVRDGRLRIRRAVS